MISREGMFKILQELEILEVSRCSWLPNWWNIILETQKDPLNGSKILKKAELREIPPKTIIFEE